MKASDLSTALDTNEVRAKRPALPVFVRNGPQYAWFPSDRSIESVVKSGVAAKNHSYVTGDFEGVEPGMVVQVRDEETWVESVTPKGLVLGRDVLKPGDEYVIGSVNTGRYLTSTLSGYRPGEASSGRWIAAVCFGCVVS